jgi:hypothetical protein
MQHQRARSFRRNVFGSALLALFAVASIALAGQPVASFTWSPASPTSGNEISFTDQSSEHPTSWLWNFGDPTGGALNTSTAQNPFFTYNLPGSYTVTLTVSNNDGQSTTTHVLNVTGGVPPICQSSDTALCLNGGRFNVTADWTKPDGSTGSGTAVKLTADSGYFWFFDASNIELVVKVLNGCGIDNSYWVFAAGLTNVQVVLNVKDEQTGAIYTNTNPQGVAYVPIQATGAFPSSCP